MNITELTDREIIDRVTPMINEVIKASNEKDWSRFSQYQMEQEAADPANRKNVESQWLSSPLLNFLTMDRDVLAVLRRGDTATLCWKQTSTGISGEYLARYDVKYVDSKLKELGFTIT